MSLPVGRAVHAFMSLMGQPTPDYPIELSEDRWELRCDLIAEEAKELDEARAAGDHEAFLDACVDLVYVVVGMAVEAGHGRYFDEAFDEVHRSNMAKATKCTECIGGSVQKDVDGSLQWAQCPTCKGRQVVVLFREDGKVLKPVDWTPPNLKKIMEAAGVEGV